MTYQLPEPVHFIMVQEKCIGYFSIDQMQAAYAAGVAEEREACLAIVKKFRWGQAPDLIIVAIRSRGEDMSDLAALKGIQGVGL